MLKMVAAGYTGVIAVLAVVVATRPSHFQIVRKQRVAAPADVVFECIESLESWKVWAPWEQLDPNMKRKYSGAKWGEGARYAWSGNELVGTGNLRVTGSHWPDRLQVQLAFERPFEWTNLMTLEIRNDGSGSQVTWQMEGERGFLARAFGLFLDVDASVGKEFERGLSALQLFAEKVAANLAKTRTTVGADAPAQ